MTLATRTATISHPSADSIRAVWTGLDGDDVGSPVFVGDYTDISVQFGAVGGATHGSATTVLQGSNDPTAGDAPASATWFTLKDVQGNSISVTSDGLRQVMENVLWIRPSQSGGSAGDLDVIAKGTR